jgi:sorbitol/mannitol transport system permease protein
MRSSRFVAPATFLIALALFFPVLWTLLTGLKSEADAMAAPPRVFAPISLGNYWSVLQGDYFHFLTNTLLAVFGSMIAAFALGLPAAYKLAFFPGPKANDILFFALSTRFMPGVAVIVPIFVLYTRLHLIDTVFGLIVIYTALNIPIVLWLMRSFFRDIPFEIIESALIESAPHRTIFLEIVLPLSKGGLATTAFLLLIMTWNEFFFAVNLTGRDAATLPVFMASFLTTEGQSWARMSAGAVLAVFPVLAIGWIASRALAKGAITGAIK